MWRMIDLPTGAVFFCASGVAEPDDLIAETGERSRWQELIREAKFTSDPSFFLWRNHGGTKGRQGLTSFMVSRGPFSRTSRL